MARPHNKQYPAGAGISPDVIDQRIHVDLDNMTAYVDERAGIKTYVAAESALRIAYYRRNLKLPVSMSVKRVPQRLISRMRLQALRPSV